MSYLQTRRGLGRLVQNEAIYKNGCFALSTTGISLHRGRIEMIYFDDPKKPQCIIFACSIYGKLNFATKKIIETERDFHHELRITDILGVEMSRPKGCKKAPIIRIILSSYHITIYPIEDSPPMDFAEPAPQLSAA